MFCLFWLVLEFPRETGILNNSKFCGAYKLIFIHVQHFDFYSSDLKQHIFSEFVYLNNLIMLDFFNFPLVGLSLLITFTHPVISLVNKYPLIFFKLQIVVNFILKFLYFDIKVS